MKGKSFLTGLLAACLLLPALTETVKADSFPPIAAPLVRQGALAVNLARSLGFSAGSEVVAIDSLSQIGIIPRGGWSAASFVTPALIGELHNSIFLASRSGQLLISGDKVVSRFNNVRFQLGLPIFPVQASARSAFPRAAISPGSINKFFIDKGPPLMTFFPPPGKFSSLFTFTPCPFVCSNVFFPGFFVRQDVSNRFFIKVSNFGRTTPALIRLDNALGFRSVRVSTDALLAAQLRSPFFNSAFRKPLGFTGRTFSRDGLFMERLSSPVFNSAFRTPVGFASPASIRRDNAIGFSSVRFSTGVLAKSPSSLRPAAFSGRFGGAVAKSPTSLRSASFSGRFGGAPKSFARAGFAKGGGRCAVRRR